MADRTPVFHTAAVVPPTTTSLPPLREGGSPVGDPDPAHEPKATRFRFKDKCSSRRRQRPRSRDRDRESRSRSPAAAAAKSVDRDGPRQRREDGSDSLHRSRHQRHHRHHHRRRRRRHRSSRSRSPEGARTASRNGDRDGDGDGDGAAEGRGGHERDPFARSPLSPDAAFRESLFDAMADDEGAAYWEGVYGQPIHVYERRGEGGGGARGADGGDGNSNGNGAGELERMTDEEYASYVRQKMWEKTHAGLLEERERRARERERRERDEAEAARITREMERSLRRGEDRRKRKAWRERWERYVAAWVEWDGGDDLGGLPWPTKSGERSEVVVDGAVREFFVCGLGLEQLGEKEFAAKLREERVRWHPDKVQQKLGGKVGEEVMRDVTAIFQVVDKLWNDMRPK